MSNTRAFQYSSGEDAATDSYLTSVAGKRAADRPYAASTEMTDVNGGSTWYTDASGGQLEYKNKCSRIIVIVFSVFLLLAGIGLCIVGRVEKDHKILPLCPKCDQFIMAMYIFGGVLIAFGFVGLVSAVTRLKCAAFLYAVVMVLLAIAMFGAGVAVVVFDTGLRESEVEDLWRDAISDHESFVCDIQDRLQCSGFYKCCQVLPTNASSPNCNATAMQLKLDCDSSCVNSNANYTEPCKNKVEAEVKSHFKPLIGVTFGLGFLMIIIAVAAVRMTLRSR
jgi:hypothetical protein